MTSYQYKIGDLLLPPSVVNLVVGDNIAVGTIPTYTTKNIARAFCELQRALGQLNNSSAGGLVSLQNYTNITGVNNSMGMIGLDCEAYLTDSGVSESGIDTASNNLYVSLEATLNPNTTIQVDHYALYTAIYHLDSMGHFSVSR
jgi:hypothetical protein